MKGAEKTFIKSNAKLGRGGWAPMWESGLGWTKKGTVTKRGGLEKIQR